MLFFTVTFPLPHIYEKNGGGWGEDTGNPKENETGST